MPVPAADLALLESVDYTKIAFGSDLGGMDLVGSIDGAVGQYYQGEIPMGTNNDGREAAVPMHGQEVQSLSFDHLFNNESRQYTEQQWNPSGYDYMPQMQHDMYDFSQTLSNDQVARTPAPVKTNPVRTIKRNRRSTTDSSGSGNGGKTSLEVFLRFVTITPDPEDSSNEIVDASKVLDKEGFQYWLETRRGSLKYPEESFRRSVTAHVTGLDGRKPFPANVEAALLRELRKQRVWPCFQGVSRNGKNINIGLQGFRTLGYNENLKATGSIAEKTKKKKHQSAETQESKKRRRHNTDKRIVMPDGHFSDKDGSEENDRERIMLLKWMENRAVLRVLMETFRVEPVEFIGDVEGAHSGLDLTTLGLDDTDLMLLCSKAQPKSIRAGIVHRIVRTLPPAVFTSHYGTVAALARQIVNPEILELMRAPIDIDDPRMHKSFTIPSAAEREFQPNLPVGHNILCPRTAVVISSDATGQRIIGSDTTGSHLSTNMDGLSFWCLISELLPALWQDGKFWFRCHVKLKDIQTNMPTMKVLLVKYTWRNEKIYSEFQDVTSLHPELDELPPLTEVVKAHLK
mmetsp:Transcript_9547/g.15638  ORF Transcript_9547/g.15638 Transcript_9547/m.15638 type:complete len:572 (-) Transcript_9547:52-1767(-)